MTVRKSCNTCIYFMRTKKYCLLLNRYVDDPSNPPCLTKRERDEKVEKGTVVSVRKITSRVEAREPAMENVNKPIVEKETVNDVASHNRKVIYNVEPPYPMTKQVQQTYFTPSEQIATSQLAKTMPPQPSVPASSERVTTIVERTIIERDYAPTGIALLDEILGGGFLRGKTYLVAGETGCGKTIFSMQFLISGALRGEPGVYIAIDEPTKQLLNGLKKFGWDVSQLISDDKLLFLDMRTHFSKIYLRDERKKIEPKYIIESILKAAKKIRAKRLVIDPIAPLIYGGKSEDVLYAREFLREMVFALEKVGELTTVMTSEIPTGSTQLSRFGVEEFLASGIIVLSIQEINGGIERIMYIRKARWAPVKPSKYVFDILPGRGIVIKASLAEYLKKKGSTVSDQR